MTRFAILLTAAATVCAADCLPLTTMREYSEATVIAEVRPVLVQQGLVTAEVVRVWKGPALTRIEFEVKYFRNISPYHPLRVNDHYLVYLSKPMAGYGRLPLWVNTCGRIIEGRRQILAEQAILQKLLRR